MKTTLNYLAIVMALSIGAWNSSLNAQPAPPPFAAFDRDGNGAISEQEFNAFRAQRLQSRAAQGRMMRGAANAPTFSSFDTDNDGLISREELSSGHRARHQQRRSMYPDAGMMGERGMRHHQGMGRGMGMQPRHGMNGPGRGGARNRVNFANFDQNGDGVISEKEFNRLRDRRRAERAEQGYPMRNQANAPQFSDIDANNNGVITAGEFSDFRARRFQQRGQRR